MTTFRQLLLSVLQIWIKSVWEFFLLNKVDMKPAALFSYLRVFVKSFCQVSILLLVFKKIE